VAVCGDSTFFHATLPALVNAIHHRSNVTLVVFDNSGTAMTGFQPHPGLPVDAMGQEAPSLDIARICEAMGAKVETRDPFNLEETRSTLNHLMEQEGVKVLILRQICALSPEKRGKKRYQMRVEETKCLGEACGCNRLCTRIFKCPGLVFDNEKKKSRIDEVICAGCGVCTDICPAGAIIREEAISS
jgi:indolepyruvate ferredoxin oxidoreductase alpha subunit